jgi:hypothetical protein
VEVQEREIEVLKARIEELENAPVLSARELADKAQAERERIEQEEMEALIIEKQRIQSLPSFAEFQLGGEGRRELTTGNHSIRTRMTLASLFVTLDAWNAESNQEKLIRHAIRVIHEARKDNGEDSYAHPSNMTFAFADYYQDIVCFNDGDGDLTVFKFTETDFQDEPYAVE